MRRVLIVVAVLLALQGIGALLFAWSGLYNIGASTGHWPVTERLLAFGMRNSIETQAAGLSPPDLDDIALVQRGAGHYENGCAPCHGAPAAPRNPISRHMLPAPPYLPEHVTDWTDAQLYWITRHGIKYAGMPAWPAPERDDEPWALAAFLRRLPDMTEEEYRTLAFGTSGRPAAQADRSRLEELAGPTADVLETCAQCHGYDGRGRGTGAFPRLDIQSADYLYAALKDYAGGARPSGIMRPMAAGLDEARMRGLAAWYAARPDTPPPRPAMATTVATADGARLALGAAIAGSGDAQRRIPRCVSCHGPGGSRASRYPALAGQHAGYIADQLRLWQKGARGDTAWSRIMAAAAQGLGPEEIEAVGAYYASLPAEPPPAPENAVRAEDEATLP